MKIPKIIAFYLPQYHPIPENDKWWGTGFTEWINVTKSKPRFAGHHQPRIPADLGYYDLRLEETRIAQAEMAEAHGISGFCYYHYWFNGKMLLERPFNEVLSSGKPDFPFCLCWANENWTRKWDGLEHEILIKQDYDEYDPVYHFDWLINAFSDKRYFRINGKPLFLFYKTDNIPHLSNQLKLWREKALENGLPGLYLCSVKSFNNSLSDEDMIKIGFDALVDFIPNRLTLPRKKIFSLPKYYVYSAMNKLISLLNLDVKIKKFPVSLIYDYKKLVNNVINNSVVKIKTFPCVIPGWDNSPRRQQCATIIQNDNAELYRELLDNALKLAMNFEVEEQIVFINAWNEWAEGCYLEPDDRNGKKFLKATLASVRSFNPL